MLQASSLRRPRTRSTAWDRPPCARIGEAALPQVRVYYEASLDYGRNTAARGRALLHRRGAGAARVRRARAQPAGSGSRAAASAALARPELDALEAELLAAYRPPASIDRHGEFIRASAALKEARELDAAGLRYGALLRYLQSLQRFAPLRGARPPPPVAAAAALAAQPPALRRAPRPRASRRPHDRPAVPRDGPGARGPGQDADPAAAQAIADNVLPRYFAALEPARPRPPRPAARATVTLVRWPYT